MINVLLAGMVTFGLVLIFTAIARSLNKPSRVDTILGQYVQPTSLQDVELAQPFSTRVLRPLFRDISRLFARRTPQQMIESVRHKLDLAGNPFDLPAPEFMGLRGLSSLFTALAMILVFSTLRANSLWITLFVGVGAWLGFYLPILWLDFKIRARQEEIEIALPDALDMLTICVEAGMGLDAAMGRVSERWNNELGKAFRRTINEVRLGKVRHEALHDMANRAEVADLTNFIAAVVQVERLGGGIAKMLRIQSESMRVSRRQRAYAKVNQTPAKLVFPLVLCFFPSLFIILLGPAAIRLFVRGF